MAIGQFAGATDESEMGEINAEVRARDELYKNRSSRKIDSQRLFSRE